MTYTTCSSLETGHESPEEEKRYKSTLSLTSALNRGGWLTPCPGTHCTGGCVGPRVGLDGCGKSRPHRDFFYFLVLSLYFIHTCFFVLTVLASTFCLLLYKTHTNTHSSGGIRTRNTSRRSAADPRLRPLG